MREGVSSVVTVTLLILMTVGLTTGAGIWASAVQQELQGETGSGLSATKGRLTANINVLGASLDLSDKELNITMRNIGEDTIRAGTAALVISDEDEATIESLLTNITSNIEQDDIYYLSTNYSSTLIQNETYLIKLTLPNGYVITTSVRASLHGEASCTAGWKCHDSSHKGYQDFDCTWHTITECPQGCSGGECVNLCDGVTCTTYCDGNTRYYDGVCSLGSCSYSTTDCTASYCDANTKYFDGECDSGSCINYDSIDCTINYCEGTTRYYNGTCINGSCSYSSEVCDNNCLNGECTTFFYPECGAGTVVSFNGSTTTFSLNNDLGCGCNSFSKVNNEVVNPGFETGDTTGWINGTISTNAYEGSYSLKGPDNLDFDYPRQAVPNYDYIRFQVNGSPSATPDTAILIAAVYPELAWVYYLMHYNLNAYSCGMKPESNTVLKCVDGLTDDGWSEVTLNPVTDASNELGIDVSGEANVTLIIGGLFNFGYFDNFMVNTTAEGKFCDTDNDGTANGICIDNSCVGEDGSATYCEVRGHEWISGAVFGSNGNCCGDDGSSDDFYSVIHGCCEGTYHDSCTNDGVGQAVCYCDGTSFIDSCGDGTCQSWETGRNCAMDCSDLFSNASIIAFSDGFRGYCNINSTYEDDLLWYNYTWEKDGVIEFSGLEFKSGSISAASDHSCGLLVNGSAVCWGYGGQGELGNGDTSRSDVPVMVSGENEFKKISTEGSTSCGLLTNGQAMCWGNGYSGQLGNGDTSSSNVPVMVSGENEFKDISVGGSHVCALLTNGQAMCWGYGYNGQLGNGANSDSSVPVTVSGENEFKKISAGNGFSCGVLINSTGLCWGYGGQGELGNGDTSSSNVPVAVSGENEFIDISAGFNFACGLLVNGSAVCWGDGNSGELGNGDTSSSNVPVMVNGENEFIDIDTGYGYACGLLTNGSAVCWGDGTDGKLGNGLETDSNVPVGASPENNFLEVATGSYHTCGVLLNGTVLCWGEGSDGELGNGLYSDSLWPVIVTDEFINNSHYWNQDELISVLSEEYLNIGETWTLNCWAENIGTNSTISSESFNIDSATHCGDGSCQFWENAYSCYSDCQGVWFDERALTSFRIYFDRYEVSNYDSMIHVFAELDSMYVPIYFNNTRKFNTTTFALDDTHSFSTGTYLYIPPNNCLSVDENNVYSIARSDEVGGGVNEYIRLWTSSDNGDTWTDMLNITLNDTTREFIGGVIGIDETVHFTYQKGNNIYYRNSSDNGVTWHDPVLVGNSTQRVFSRDLTVFDDIINVFWLDQEPCGIIDEVTYSQSTDDGATWSPKSYLTPDDCNYNELEDIVVDGDTIHLIFNDYRVSDYPDIHYMKSTDKGITWGETTNLTTINELNAGHARLAIDNSNFHLVYSANSEVYYKNSTDSGATWNEPVMLSKSDNRYSRHPDIIVENNQVHVFWVEDDKLYYRLRVD